MVGRSATISVESYAYIVKATRIIQYFSGAHQVVKAAFARKEILGGLISLLPDIPDIPCLTIMQSIRELVMHPNTLAALLSKSVWPQNAIPILVDLCRERNNPSLLQECIKVLYYISQAQAQRLEQMALSGIMPVLRSIIEQDQHLKELAFPILFSIVQSSPKARAEIRRLDGVQFLVDLMELGIQMSVPLPIYLHPGVGVLLSSFIFLMM